MTIQILTLVSSIKFYLELSYWFYMILFIIFILLSLTIFINSIYYSLCLLAFIISLLYFIVSINIISSLTMIMLCIVYVGAIIILIGYICAICPNIIVESSRSIVLVLISSTLLFLLFSPIWFPTFSIVVPIVDYFYSLSGAFMFFVVIFMLFLTLLIVTSQYLTPKGPFRSVS